MDQDLSSFSDLLLMSTKETKEEMMRLGGHPLRNKYQTTNPSIIDIKSTKFKSELRCHYFEGI